MTPQSAVSSILACLLLPAFAAAQNGPATRPAEPPADVIRLDAPLRQPLPAAVQRRLERSAFLGVSTATPADALREQLGLGRYVGLQVDRVEPGSPAEAAGIRKHDVLHKLGDQILINPHQLSALIRSHKPGEEIELALIRQAKPIAVKAKLAEREMLALDDMFAPMPPGLMPDMPWGPLELPAEIARGLRVRVQTPGEEAAAVMCDDEHTLLFRQCPKWRKLEVRDKEGKVIFDGPVDTDEQIRALPPGVAEKLEVLRANLAGAMPPAGDRNR